MVITALQPTDRLSWTIDLSQVSLHNFVILFETYGFGRAVLNSAVVVTLSCLINVVVCSMAAFAFAKKPFPGSGLLFWVYLATMMVPGQITLIPLFIIMRDLGLLNTYISLSLPVINAFGVFLIYQFMGGIPDELIEAARIDGASDLRIFLSIVVPLIRPVLVALTVFTFLTVWNDFLWPLVSISDQEMNTVTVAVSNLQGAFAKRYGLVMAGATISFIVPLTVYLVLQRQFVEGVAATGLKG
ncbi:carbohydrate ABC transporter permease [Actinomyces sp. 186855]|nr:carbohydrate ABC transporter permease [Actinomyces sp. 186855]MCL3778690.1 carbohydrate ABC transporter permease [Actinomyces sp. AC-20-1]MCL3789971.1 carbohydrate ABC transporter permease [Actinomyces sp. 187325]MCL3792310.1 carbohydrate ABC transporter permease [Actinomyces sp. 186855]MCL3794512.1 carbohydrate ABC transporter permease [Actinomyces sp. 217892]